MSFLTQSHQVFFGHPLCLIPSTSHVIQHLTQSLSSFRSTCPNHLILLFSIIKLTGSNNKSSLSSSLCFLSVLRTEASICHCLFLSSGGRLPVCHPYLSSVVSLWDCTSDGFVCCECCDWLMMMMMRKKMMMMIQ